MLIDIQVDDLANRIEKALNVAAEYGLEDGSHHKMWVIDQMVRALTGSPIAEESHKKSKEYLAFVRHCEEWDEGSAP